MHAVLSTRRLPLLLVVLALIAVACSSDAAQEEPAAGAEVEAESETSEDGELEGEEAAEVTTTTQAPEPDDEVDAEPVVEPTADVGVTSDAIRIGYSLDLSGPFSFRDARILDGHFALFEEVNESGGVAGRMIEVVGLDNTFDVPTHLDNVGMLLDEESDGIALIGGLSHPNFDDATISAVGEAGLLIVGNTAPTETPVGATAVVPLLSLIHISEPTRPY